MYAFDYHDSFLSFNLEHALHLFVSFYDIPFFKKTKLGTS